MSMCGRVLVSENNMRTENSVCEANWHLAAG